MSDELILDGKTYISSKRAAQSSGYAQDYIGQLARKGLIDARRIGGLWYVFLDSLNGHKEKAETIVREAPKNDNSVPEPETLVFFDGKDYVSAHRAAEITGYNQDYIGQLARAGKIVSKQVGNRWYVDREGLEQHKGEKDSLLAAVQAESVGLAPRNTEVSHGAAAAIEKTSEINTEISPLLTYTADSGSLLPPMPEKIAQGIKDDTLEVETVAAENQSPEEAPITRVPINIKASAPSGRHEKMRQAIQISPKRAKNGPKTAKMAALSLLLMILGGAFYYVSKNQPQMSKNSLVATSEAAVSKAGNILEPFISRELVYTRQP